MSVFVFKQKTAYDRRISDWSSDVCSSDLYDAAWRLSKRPELFGKGSVEGIAGAESGNNAVSGANLIPLLGLGVPGDLEAAILMGAFLLHGLTPGPLIFQEAPEVVYAIYIGLILANVMLLGLGLGLIPVFSRLTRVRVEIGRAHV